MEALREKHLYIAHTWWGLIYFTGIVQPLKTAKG